VFTGTYHDRDRTGWSLASRRRRSHSSLVRIITIILLGLIMIAGFGGAAPEDTTAGQAGTINTNRVEVFAHLADFTVIDYLENGDRVDIFSGPEEFMYEIHYNGIVGWVWAEFLDPDGSGTSRNNSSIASPPSQGSPSSSADQAGAWSWRAWAMVDADALNVRDNASMGAGVIDSYIAGEWIEVIGNDLNGFSPINHDGEVAWVATEYLSWDGEFNNSSVSSDATGAVGSGSTDSSEEHWIDVNARTGLVTLYIGDSVQATHWGSVGFDTSSDGFYATAVGTFYVYAMYEPIAYTKWADAYITHWVGFDPTRFNGFHSYSKDANGAILPNGAGKTGGCVALDPAAIQEVFDFSHMGMRVEVHR